MKYLFLTISFAFSSHQFLAFAQQLPIVQAKAMQSEKYYNWLISKPKRDEQVHNIWLVSGCKESVNNVAVSSSLPSQPNENYIADNLADDDPTTAWIGGKNGNIGEFVEFMAFPYSKWHLLNGHQKDKTTWENYARVKKLRIFIEGKPAFEVVLEDKMGTQTFELPENLKIDPDKISTGTKIKMVILSVYEGKKFKEVAISELFFAGC
ncbi:MAG: hypothetical protein EAZ08_11195 [Cytophagales bacterium]|nr:MAG: hypothetical protein EAZ08_11195 [Cytophagales bacterium]